MTVLNKPNSRRRPNRHHRKRVAGNKKAGDVNTHPNGVKHFNAENDCEITGLLRYWQFYHFITPENQTWVLEQISQGRMMVETDETTGLDVYSLEKEREDIYNVDGVIEGKIPDVVTVDDEGIFTALYGSDIEKTLGMTDYAKKATWGLAWNNTKAVSPVWEVYKVHIPSALVIFQDNTFAFYGTWEKARIYVQAWKDFVILMREKQLPYHFPMSVYVEEHLPDYDVMPLLTGGNTTGINFPPALPAPKTTYKYQDFKPPVPLNPFVHKSMCGFDSTCDFLKANLGIWLDQSDRKWYEDNEKVIGEGLPKENTLSVLTELVKPYGIEIGEVWAANLFWVDEFTEFAQKLGMENEMTKMMREAGMLAEEPRFHVNVTPNGFPRCVMTKFGTVGGHAHYYAPRSLTPEGWLMALSFRKIK